MHEPNYALHLEVAEFINTKKANNPRDAAMSIARLANHRNPHIAILALALLDTLVQSCGYPFHLQISTKEFLNELVRRFPERPPPFPGPVMSRILELINTWKEGICTESRWKEDLGNIRDMHRLLTFKGYRFRDLMRQNSLASASNLKSAEELEEEDREAQSAKLQELIRRGTPRDLAAAQKLMKSLAGANPDAKPDYRSQALTDLNKLEQKVILLNEMLDNVDSARGERFVEGDAYDQVSHILVAARPKLQKWISDAETDDPESLDIFLQINDQINSVITRYEAFKKGDLTVASNPIPTELSNSQGLSLIDLDDEAIPTTTAAGGNDLAGLFSTPSASVQTAPVGQAPSPISTNTHMVSVNVMGTSMGVPTPMGMGTPVGMGTPMGVGMPMGMGTPRFMQPQPQTYAPSPVTHNGARNTGMGMIGSMTPPHQSATPPASIMLPNTPAPNYFGAGGQYSKGPVFTAAGMGSSMGGSAAPRLGVGMGATPYAPSPPITQPQQQQQPRPAPSSTTAQQGKDPFADLAGLF